MSRCHAPASRARARSITLSGVTWPGRASSAGPPTVGDGGSTWPPGTGSGMAKPYANAGATVNVIGMTAVTGLPETWQIEAHHSFASIEELDQRLGALGPARTQYNPSDLMQDDVLAPARTMMAVYRPAWSYRPDQAKDGWNKMQAWFKQHGVA